MPDVRAPRKASRAPQVSQQSFTQRTGKGRRRPRRRGGGAITCTCRFADALHRRAVGMQLWVYSLATDADTERSPIAAVAHAADESKSWISASGEADLCGQTARCQALSAGRRSQRWLCGAGPLSNIRQSESCRRPLCLYTDAASVLEHCG